jgi:four helix bundle protein
MLPENREAAILRKQLVRAGPSIGSNVQEAEGAETKPEKRRILIIARREAREARYWLRIAHPLWSPGVNVEADIQEASELINILSSIMTKLG